MCARTTTRHLIKDHFYAGLQGFFFVEDEKDLRFKFLVTNSFI